MVTNNDRDFAPVLYKRLGSFSSGVSEGFIGRYTDSEADMHVVSTLAIIWSGGCVQMAVNPERVERDKPTLLSTFVYSWVFLLCQITFALLFFLQE